MSHGRLVNLAAFHCFRNMAGTKHEGKYVDVRTTEQLVKEFEGWEEEAGQLLQVRYIFCSMQPLNVN